MSTRSIRKSGQSLAHGVVEALTQRIQAGTLPAGARLPPENALVQAFGVSRTVVREALSRLQAAGRVETRHGVGTFVLASQHGLHLAADTAQAVGKILDIRLGLESQAAALAARYRQPEHLQGMRKALDDYQANLGEDERCAAADWQFHLLIAQATGNSYFTELMAHLGRGMIPRTQVKPVERGGEDLSSLALPAAREHEAIYRAIKRQDADGARAAMWLHLANSRERFKAG